MPNLIFFLGKGNSDGFTGKFYQRFKDGSKLWAQVTKKIKLGGGSNKFNY